MNEDDLIRRGDVYDDLDWLKKNVCPSNVDGVMEMKKRIAQVEAVVSESSTELAKEAVRNYKIGHGIRITRKPGENPGRDEMWINRNIAAHCVDIEEEAIVNACIRAAIEEKLDNLYLIDRQFVINALKMAMGQKQGGWIGTGGMRCMNDDLISKSALLDMLNYYVTHSIEPEQYAYKVAQREVEKAPAVDAVPVERLGDFGKLFLDYEGCSRGAIGRAGGTPIEEEVLAMKPIWDVDGGEWIPVNADALRELVEEYKSMKNGARMDGEENAAD